MMIEEITYLPQTLYNTEMNPELDTEAITSSLLKRSLHKTNVIYPCCALTINNQVKFDVVRIIALLQEKWSFFCGPICGAFKRCLKSTGKEFAFTGKITPHFQVHFSVYIIC